MTKKKIAFLFAVTLGVGGALTGCGEEDNSASSNGGESSPEEVIEFDLGHTLVPGSPRDEAVNVFKEALEEKSNGTMTINSFPQSQLGGEVEMQEAVQSGNQDMVFTSSSTLANIVPEFGILDVPYIFEDLDEATEKLRSDAGQQLLDLLPDVGMVGLGYVETVDRNVFADVPINKAEDLQGLKIRVIEAPGYVETYSALGAQPTPMAYAELYTSLQQGVVDGGDTSADQFVMDRFMEVKDQFSLSGMNHIAIVAVISQSVWDGLTAEQQEIVQEAFDEASDFAPEEFSKQREQYLQEMKDEGVTVVDTDKESLKTATEEVRQRLIDNTPNGQELFDAFQN